MFGDSGPFVWMNIDTPKGASNFKGGVQTKAPPKTQGPNGCFQK